MFNTQLRLAARNATRRKVRTGLTAGMVVAGVSLLLLLITWVEGAMAGTLGRGTSGSGHVRVVDPDFAAKEQLQPLEEHLIDVVGLANLVARQPGVIAVEPRLATGVTVTAGEEIGEVFARLLGAHETYFRERLSAKERLVDGRWFSEGAEDELIAGATVVRETGAKVGDELLLLGATQDGSLSPIKGRLVGVVKGDSEINQVIMAPLGRVQYMTDIDGGATELLVYAETYDDAGALAASLRAVPELSAYSVTAWSEREPWKSLSGAAAGIQFLIVFVVVLLVSLGIWNTMMMSVLERTHEIGVLRALGMTRLGAMGLFVGEALAIGVVGGALGVLLGAVPSYLLEKYGVHIGEQAASSTDLALADTMYGDLTGSGILLALVVGVVMAVLGSILPSLRAASIEPVAAMRSGR